MTFLASVYFLNGACPLHQRNDRVEIYILEENPGLNEQGMLEVRKMKSQWKLVRKLSIALAHIRPSFNFGQAPPIIVS